MLDYIPCMQVAQLFFSRVRTMFLDVEGYPWQLVTSWRLQSGIQPVLVFAEGPQDALLHHQLVPNDRAGHRHQHQILLRRAELCLQVCSSTASSFCGVPYS